MTLLTIQPTPIADTTRLPFSSSVATLVLNSNNDGIGVFVKAPKTGNVKKILGSITSMAGAPTTLRVGIEGQASGLREPDGVYKGGGTAKADITPSVAAFSPNLDSPLAVTEGDNLFLTARAFAGFDASNTASITLRTPGTIASYYPYCLQLVDGVWSGSSNVVIALSFEYDDGTRPNNLCWVTSATNQTGWNNASNSLFRGNKWTPQYGCRVSAVCFTTRPPASSTGSFRVRVYDSSNNLVSASAAAKK